MREFLKDYIEAIKELPIKNKYSKEELLINDFLIQKEGKVEIYYAPHNEYINPKAKVFIVGITPGFQQMNAAIVEARKGIEKGREEEKIKIARNMKLNGLDTNTIAKITNLSEDEIDKLYF